MPISRDQLLKAALGRAREHVKNDAMEEARAARQFAPSRQLNEQYNGGTTLYKSNDTEFSYQDVDTELSYTGGDEPDVIYEGRQQYASGGYSQPSQDIAYNEATAANSRMPDGIKQSMLENQIDTSKLGVGASVLDDLGMQPVQKPQKRVIRENTQYQQAPATVDYNKIKEIVLECLEEALDDTSLKTIQLNEGKIRLVDNGGRIFVATLEYKGNVKDKQKK